MCGQGYFFSWLYFFSNFFTLGKAYIASLAASIFGLYSSKLNLSQSEYIRNLIVGYEIKIPEVKEEPKPKKEEYIIENIVKALEENIECLIKVKNKFHYLGYFEDERAIGTKIEYLRLQNSTLKKYIQIKDDKDNAN